MGVLRLAAAGAAAATGYRLLLDGRLTVDLGWGRTLRALGPLGVDVAAPPETVFDVIAEPYLGRTPRSMAGKLEVLERGSDLVVAAHHTPVRPGLVATTVESVRFSRPDRIDFRLLRGPVPHVLEEFRLHGTASGTHLAYDGELGADLWGLGQWWGDLVAEKWVTAVRSTLASVRTEAERRAALVRR